MKNANVFVDVDFTLVNADGRLYDGAQEALQRLRDAGCHLFLWSSVGADYAGKVAARYGLPEMFEGYVGKPDIIIDDIPATAQTQLAYNVHDETSWQSLAERVIQRHID